MSIQEKKTLAIRGATRASSAGQKLVGRLLTPAEMELIVGADGNCNTGNGNHAMSSGSNFNQAGGSFNQNGGGTYTMNCRPAASLQ